MTNHDEQIIDNHVHVNRVLWDKSVKRLADLEADNLRLRRVLIHIGREIDRECDTGWDAEIKMIREALNGGSK